MTAVELTLSRLVREEGRKPFAYDDATGKRVTCQPEGNLTIGYGINLETGLDAAEMEWLLEHRLGLIEKQLRAFAWYGNADPVRQSVFLDMAYNGGVHGLLHFAHMLAAAEMNNWPLASKECSVLDVKLDTSRYAPLRQLLLSGAA